MTKDEVQRSRWTFCEVVKLQSPVPEFLNGIILLVIEWNLEFL
jgi:hypothetical protein